MMTCIFSLRKTNMETHQFIKVYHIMLSMRHLKVILQVKDYLDSVLDQNENKDLVEELKEELMKKKMNLKQFRKQKNRIVQGFLMDYMMNKTLLN